MLRHVCLNILKLFNYCILAFGNVDAHISHSLESKTVSKKDVDIIFFIVAHYTRMNIC